MVFVNISSNRILYPEVVDLVKEVFLAILIQAMRSIGESRMTDQYPTVINGLLQKNSPIDTFEQDLKVAQVCRVENEEQPTVCFQGPQGDRRTSPLRPKNRCWQADFWKIVCFGAKSFRLCKIIREKRCIFTPINCNLANRNKYELPRHWPSFCFCWQQCYFAVYK